MDARTDKLKRLARFAGEALAETLWPTRCAICDVPGAVLCDRCAANLPYLDWWKACPRCGSPFGLVQCDSCNPVTLGRVGRAELPFAGCASATVFGEQAGRLVRVYKDQGERRLARDLACCMVRMVAPDWRYDAVTFVPATRNAMGVRGFDHAELLAREVAAALQVECIATLARPKTHDQRALGGRDRIANLASSFQTLDGRAAGSRLILVDDVYTTGATLCAAADALLASGADAVYALTFARV